MEKKLETIVAVKEFLIAWRDEPRLSLGQFCKDWIEETLCDVLRKDADCYEFFFPVSETDIYT